MTSVSFLFPAPPGDAVSCFFTLLARHCKRFAVRQDQTVEDALAADVVVPTTTVSHYTRERIDADAAALRAAGKPFTLLHHNDNGQPSPGDYPSACWTRTGWHRLREDYAAELVRLPVFPAVHPPHRGPLRVGTYGIVEPKKHTKEMFQRCKEIGVPFAAYGPEHWYERYREYVDQLRGDGCPVRLLPWVERLEDCLPLLECSHFLFFLPPSKRDTGGGSMTPRNLTLFGRPTVVIDDEDTYEADDFTVLPALGRLERGHFLRAPQPNPAWGPDEYVGRLAELASGNWRRA